MLQRIGLESTANHRVSVFSRLPTSKLLSGTSGMGIFRAVKFYPAYPPLFFPI